MNSASFTYIALGLLPAVCTCELQSKSCTLIGCNDQFVVEISQAGVSMPNFAADLVIDGRTASCSAPSFGTAPTCDSGVTAGWREQLTCTSQNWNCAGNGTYVEMLIITGAPKTVNISLRTGAGIVAQQTFQPHYTSNEPNGPGCAPVCNQATMSWSLP